MNEVTNKKKDEENQTAKSKFFPKIRRKIMLIIEKLTKDFTHKKPSEFFREYPA
jgi:hypothetical protein